MPRSEDTNDVRPHPRTPPRSRVLAGPVGGIAGGLVMIAFLACAAVAQGLEPLAAIEPMGATFLQPEALEGSTGRLVYGLSLHFAGSALVGLLFAAVLPRDFPPATAALLCVGLAFVVMAFAASTIVPAVNPVLDARFHDLGGSWVLAHALYGATTGFSCQRLRQGLAVRTGRPLRHRTA